MPKEISVKVPQTLLKEALEAVCELVERHLDDKYENGQAGSYDGELDCLKEARKIKSLERKLKRLLNLPEEEDECPHLEHESGVCCDCGEVIKMQWKWEHDAGDMER
jgi:hypothetical protein